MVAPPEAAAEPSSDLVKTYYETLDKYASIELEKNLINQRTNKQSAALISELIDAINKKTFLTVMGILEILAETNNLALIKKEPKFLAIFQQEKKQPPEFWTGGFDLEYLKSFLQWLLLDKLAMAENEAAIFALKLANILRRKGDGGFMKIAYGDAQTQSFRFSE